MSADVLETLKRMAWERAKGELLAMLATYHSPVDPKTCVRDTTDYDAMHTRVWSFIGNVENHL